MRKPLYLSPTSLNLFHSDRTEFYVRYLCDNRTEREPQTKPMSIGSAFDAYVKSYLHEKLFGKGTDPQFERDTLFEAQVESHNRDWAKTNGAYVFLCYSKSGALADLLLNLEQAVGRPRFEIELRGTVDRDVAVPFLGKPDVFFLNKQGHPIILDWKVNGYCSKSAVSPMQGFVNIRPGGKGPHKDAVLGVKQGMTINTSHRLETLNEDWATQLSIYGWLCGADIGSDFIVAVDQIVAKPTGSMPELRIAEHRLQVSAAFQEETYKKAATAWTLIESGHIFDDLPRDESDQKCLTLDNRSKLLGSFGDNPEDKFFKELCIAPKAW